MNFSELTPDQLWEVKQVFIVLFAIFWLLVWGITSLLFHVSKDIQIDPEEDQQDDEQNTGRSKRRNHLRITIFFLLMCSSQMFFAQGAISEAQINDLVGKGYFIQAYELPISYVLVSPTLSEIEKLSKSWEVLRGEDTHIRELSLFADSVYHKDLFAGGYAFHLQKQNLSIINYLFLGKEFTEINFLYNTSRRFICIVVDNNLVSLRPGGVFVYKGSSTGLKIIRNQEIFDLIDWFQKT